LNLGLFFGGQIVDYHLVNERKENEQPYTDPEEIDTVVLRRVKLGKTGGLNANDRHADDEGINCGWYSLLFALAKMSSTVAESPSTSPATFPTSVSVGPVQSASSSTNRPPSSSGTGLYVTPTAPCIYSHQDHC